MRDSFKITLIVPHVGRKDPTNLKEYVRTWQMPSLTMPILAGLTPKDVEIKFFDERVEFIDFEDKTDLVAITVETFTAKRAYEISAIYKARGTPVVMGGYHAMLKPAEVSHFADACIIGFAESIWPQVVKDARNGNLQSVYERSSSSPVTFGMPDRRILGKKNYLPLVLSETGRGCPHSCGFCSITSATKATYWPRPVDQVVKDLVEAKSVGIGSDVFLIDDNIVGNPRYAKELFTALKDLRIRWFSQGTLTMARDKELLKLMAESGCMGVLIGFESVNEKTLKSFGKDFNIPLLRDMKESVKRIHDFGICIYGTYIFGYDESLEDILATAHSAEDLELFMVAFNHMIPFPGTRLFKELEDSGQLTDTEWYLDPSYRFGQTPFTPKLLSPRELHDACIQARKHFYRYTSILKRSSNWKGNLTTPSKALRYFIINYLLHREVGEKDGLPLGNLPARPQLLAPA